MTFWQHMSIDAYHGRLSPEAFSQSFADFLRGYEAVRRVDDREISDHLKLRTDFIRKLMEKSWDKEFFGK
jgi:hypothetical protein